MENLDCAWDSNVNSHIKCNVGSGQLCSSSDLTPELTFAGARLGDQYVFIEITPSNECAIGKANGQLAARTNLKGQLSQINVDLSVSVISDVKVIPSAIFLSRSKENEEKMVRLHRTSKKNLRIERLRILGDVSCEARIHSSGPATGTDGYFLVSVSRFPPNGELEEGHIECLLNDGETVKIPLMG